MYARIDIRIMKTLVTNGDLDKARLGDLYLRASYQQKNETLSVLISERGPGPSVPMLGRMRKWYAVVPTVSRFCMTKKMVDNLHDMELVNRYDLHLKYEIKVEEKVIEATGIPYSLWWFAERL